MARFVTYFGVPVPVFREEKLGAGAITIRFVLQGRVVSKKNHQMAVTVRKEAKDFLKNKAQATGMVSLADALAAVDMVKAKMIGNKEYYEFLKHFRPVIEWQMATWRRRLEAKGLKFPLQKAALSLRLFFKDKYITDTVNKQQTIQDLLVDCGVIQNDDYRSLNPINSASARYYQELTENITFISLTFKIDKTKNEREEELIR